MFGSMGQTAVKNLGNGGTIDGDLVITGDLQVSGGGSLSFDEIIEGTQVIDVTSTEALLIRKNGDAGDIFIVDTTNSRLYAKAPAGSLPAMYFEQHTSATDGTLGQINFGNRAVDGQLAVIEAINDGANDSAALLFKTEVTSGALTEAMRITSTGKVLIDQNSNATAFEIDAENTDATGVDMVFGAMTSGYGVRIRSGSADAALTTGTLLDVYSKDSDTSTRNLMRIVNDDGNATGTTALKIQQDSTGLAIHTTGAISIDETGGTSNSAILQLKADRASDGQDAAEIQFYNNHASYYAGIFGERGSADNYGDLIIKTRNASGLGERLRIDEDGATTLAGTLTVNGTNATIANATNPYLYINDTNAGAAIFQQSGNDTRIGSDSNTQVLFVQNNATAVTIDTSKNVGIGESSPDRLLHIKGAAPFIRTESTSAGTDAASGLIEFYATTTRMGHVGFGSGANSDMDITNAVSGGNIDFTTTGDGTFNFVNGTVGIGTETPGFGQDAGEAITNASTLLEVAGTGGNADGATIVLRNTATAIDASTDSELGMIKFAGNDTDVSLNEDGVSSMIRCLVTDTWNATTNDRPSQLEFWTTADGSGAMAQNMTINKNGYVGIKTGSNVDSQLHVQDDASNCVLRIEATASHTGARLQLISNANDTGDINFGDDADTNDGRITYNHTGRYMAFHAADVSRFKLDANSRISLSNNDNSNTGNTIFGASAFNCGADNGSDYNVVIGQTAMGTGTVSAASHNVAIGADAIADSTSATGNVAIGSSAMYNSVSPDNCVAIGRQAIGTGNNTIDGTIAIGYQSLKALTSGEYNVAVGYQSLLVEDDGDKSTAIGHEALTAQTGTSGTVGNTAVGYQAGNNITTGVENTIVGSFSTISAVGGQNQTIIGGGITGNGNNSVVLGNTSVTDVYMAKDSGATVHCAGIKFDASGEVLGDYEEGVDVVALASASGTVGLDADFNHIGYTKVGRAVHIQGHLYNTTFSSGDGVLTITGLPFTSVGDLNDKADTATFLIRVKDGDSADGFYLGIMLTNTTVITVDGYDAENLNTSTSLHISGTYMTA